MSIILVNQSEKKPVRKIVFLSTKYNHYQTIVVDPDFIPSDSWKEDNIKYVQLEKQSTVCVPSPAFRVKPERVLESGTLIDFTTEDDYMDDGQFDIFISNPQPIPPPNFADIPLKQDLVERVIEKPRRSTRKKTPKIMKYDFIHFDANKKSTRNKR